MSKRSLQLLLFACLVIAVSKPATGISLPASFPAYKWMNSDSQPRQSFALPLGSIPTNSTILVLPKPSFFLLFTRVSQS